MKERDKELRLRLMGWGIYFRKVFREGQSEKMPKEEKELQGECSW